MNIMQELNKKRKGFVMLPVILATFIVGLLGVGLTSIYSGAFATMSASKSANDAQNVAAVEKEIIQALGYDGYAGEITDFKSMADVLGDANTDWEYSVQKVSEKTNSDGSNIAVVKINVRKKGDSVIRYSEEVPLSSKNTNRFTYNDTTDKTKRVALKYEQSADEDTPSLHGYVNGVEVPFASQSGSGGKYGYDSLYYLPNYFVAPCDGFVVITYYAHDSVTGTIKINGKRFTYGRHEWDGGCGSSSCFPVKKGSIIEISTNINGGQYQPGITSSAFFISF